MNSKAFARQILDRARDGWPYSERLITRCLRITGDLPSHARLGDNR